MSQGKSALQAKVEALEAAVAKLFKAVRYGQNDSVAKATIADLVKMIGPDLEAAGQDSTPLHAWHASLQAGKFEGWPEALAAMRAAVDRLATRGAALPAPEVMTPPPVDQIAGAREDEIAPIMEQLDRDWRAAQLEQLKSDHTVSAGWWSDLFAEATSPQRRVAHRIREFCELVAVLCVCGTAWVELGAEVDPNARQAAKDAIGRVAAAAQNAGESVHAELQKPLSDAEALIDNFPEHRFGVLDWISRWKGLERTVFVPIHGRLLEQRPAVAAPAEAVEVPAAEAAAGKPEFNNGRLKLRGSAARPIVMGKVQELLSPAVYNTVLRIAIACQQQPEHRFRKDELAKLAETTAADKYLRALFEASDEWAQVIDLPARIGRGYRVE